MSEPSEELKAAAKAWRAQEIGGLPFEWIGLGYSGKTGAVWVIVKDFAAFDEKLSKFLAERERRARQKALEEAAQVKWIEKRIEYTSAYNPSGNNQNRHAIEIEVNCALSEEVKQAIRALETK